MIGPDHPDFENLPRKEQAAVYKKYGWTHPAIAEELDVCLSTVKRWLNPKYELAVRKAIRAYQKTDKGRALKRRSEQKRRAKKPKRPLSQTKTAIYMREYMRKRRNDEKAQGQAHETR